MLGSQIHRMPHARGAVPEHLSELVKVVIEADKLPKFDDVYVFVDFNDRVAPLRVRVWVIGFSGRMSGGRYADGGIVLASPNYPPESDWSQRVKELFGLYSAGAVVVTNNELGVTLFLRDTLTPVITAETFLAIMASP